MNFQYSALCPNYYLLSRKCISWHEVNNLAVGGICQFNIPHCFLHPFSQLLTFIAACWYLSRNYHHGLPQMMLSGKRAERHLPSSLLDKYESLPNTLNLVCGHKDKQKIGKTLLKDLKQKAEHEYLVNSRPRTRKEKG